MTQIIMRRIQVASLIVALLAAPFALVARGYACAPHACTMMCCPPHKRAGLGMKMDCHAAASSSVCVMQCNSRQGVDYGLACPLPPTQTTEAPAIPMPKITRRSLLALRHFASAGFSFAPFEPPRA